MQTNNWLYNNQIIINLYHKIVTNKLLRKYNYKKLYKIVKLPNNN